MAGTDALSDALGANVTVTTDIHIQTATVQVTAGCEPGYWCSADTQVPCSENTFNSQPKASLVTDDEPSTEQLLVRLGEPQLPDIVLATPIQPHKHVLSLHVDGSYTPPRRVGDRQSKCGYGFVRQASAAAPAEEIER